MLAKTPVEQGHYHNRVGLYLGLYLSPHVGLSCILSSFTLHLKVSHEFLVPKNDRVISPNIDWLAMCRQ
jgi:hypothetical protein